MKKKYIHKSYLTVTPDTFSSFDLAKIKNHLDVNAEASKDIISQIEVFITKLAQKHNITGEEFCDILFSILKVNVVKVYAPDEVSPKTFMLGISLIKSAISFSRQLSVLNMNITGLHNASFVEEKLKEMMQGFPVSWDNIPTASENYSKINSN